MVLHTETEISHLTNNDDTQFDTEELENIIVLLVFIIIN